MRTKKIAVAVAGALAALVLTVRCDSESPQKCICTEEFRSVVFAVISHTGAPVPVTDVVVTQVRTGTVLPVLQPGLHAGVVHVADDSFRSQLQPAGDVLHAVATTDMGTVAADVTVGVDEPCHCHVQRLSGPDLVPVP